MTTITEFVTARLDEDEQLARESARRNGHAWRLRYLMDDCWGVAGTVDPGHPRGGYGDQLELWDDEGALGMYRETARHIARHDPARILAQCAALRAVVEAHRIYGVGISDRHEFVCCVADEADWPCLTVRHIASIWRTHPEWREEWGA